MDISVILYSVLAGIMLRDLFPEPDIVCKTLKTEQTGAVSWILEWILKGLEGVKLYQDADEKSSSQAELLSTLRFCDSRNKIERSHLLCRIFLFGLDYWVVGLLLSMVGVDLLFKEDLNCIDQIRILTKSRILWNHGRNLLCPGPVINCNLLLG